MAARAAEAFGWPPEVPVGTVLRDQDDSSLWDVCGGIAEGGGYYLIRSRDGSEARLQPGHIGGLYQVVQRAGERP